MIETVEDVAKKDESLTTVRAEILGRPDVLSGVDTDWPRQHPKRSRYKLLKETTWLQEPSADCVQAN